MAELRNQLELLYKGLPATPLKKQVKKCCDQCQKTFSKVREEQQHYIHENNQLKEKISYHSQHGTVAKQGINTVFLMVITYIYTSIKNNYKKLKGK